MAAINIRSDVKDSFYRYKMPRLVAKVEGKGNGIKTVIPNMADIGKSLSRPAMYPCKYFGCELGAQTKHDTKNDRYIVNGAHDAQKLQQLLDGFISRFVLCGSCKNPETDLVFTKDESIVRDCKACGQRTDIDMRHRLVTFILKNPPPTAKKSRKSKKGGSENASEAGDANGVADGDGSDDELTRRIREEAAALPDAPLHDDDDDDWAVDVSEEAQARRMREIESSLNTTLVLGDDDEDEDENGDSGPTAYDKFGEAIEKNIDMSDAEIIAKAKEFGVFGKHRAVIVLVQVIFTDKMVQQIRKRSALLKQFVKTEKDQKSLLGGIERLVGIKYPNMMSKVPAVLKILYDDDLVDEAVVLKWGARASKRYVDKDVSKKVKAAAEPFLTWLQEADEETEEESDEE
ncbi:domain found in IF2B/IF5-domain-containing protein [Thamnocephalis sphaerospora]|uniref:Domain found in IF2B/IF5-domain-containing protein n=1 Tax=Thamnocephalis sphaerospora TaxID=78915 RepID=A0A4P9XQH5_9FUNG|nr:domain found in IF2B/IF5-domain-containing protein [Thamnocephalis sphaerospora]|eukprot:RKP08293.1 domain found in IF2B/IF5-domain-containing protein [Thamnocephalis sphaerospora]